MKKVSLLFLFICFSVFISFGCSNSPEEKPEGQETNYSITFIQEGYTNVIKTVKKGASLLNSDIPTHHSKKGYTVKWEDKDLSNVNSNITVNAIEIPNKYIITYDVNGGTMYTITQEVIYGKSFSLAQPTRENFTFIAWEYNGVAFTQGIWSIDEDVTLVAKWQENVTNQYTVSFLQSGKEPIIITVNEGESLTSKPNPIAKVGYSVIWEEVDLININSNMTVNAIETPNTYTITVENGFAETYQKTVTYDQEYLLDIPEKDGYNFLKWVKKNTNIEVTSGIWQSTENITIVVVWEEVERWTKNY